MKLALFYPRNIYASWYALGGYRLALEAMGHEVVDCPLPGNNPANIDQLKYKPSIEQLTSCDAILLMFAEYVVPWLQVMYGGLEQWRSIPTHKIARFDESFDRADLSMRMNWDMLKLWADYYSFPAAQDAEKFKGEWIGYGIDQSIFHPPAYPDKKYGLGFIGQLYNKREKYAQLLLPYLDKGTTFSCGPVIITDLSGTPAEGYERLQTELLAKNFQQIKVFFVLPPLAQLQVSKIFEVMSCGTFVIAPRLEGAGRKNLSLFQEGKHLVYYQQGDFVGNAKQIMYWLKHDDEREAIARQGAQHMKETHTLEMMLNKILAPVIAKKELKHFSKEEEQLVRSSSRD